MEAANISAEFPFDSHFVTVHDSPMHYVESGVGDPIVFLHGNPTSSYLWRNVIPHLSPLGRCVAPDLIGMGRSGKPEIEYRFFDHVRYVEGFLETLGLRDITLVIHDWGSALGFDYAMRHPKNIKAIAFLEAIVLPLPDFQAFPDGMREMFRAFRSPDQGRKLIIDQNIFIERVLPDAILRKLSEEEMNRYREPFLEPKSREPLWRWPNEIPVGGEPADVEAVVTDYNLMLQQSEIPKLLLYATPGAVLTAPLVEWCRRSLKNLTAVNVGPGIHYLQEDHPHEIGQAIASWYRDL
jgi:haloalkane dehalogenase